ncbi:MAG: hypothetical protein ACE5O2_02670 [Armatimonadota bacterium]
MTSRLSAILKALACGFVAGALAGFAGMGLMSRSLFHMGAHVWESTVAFRWMLVGLLPLASMALAVVADSMGFIDDRYVLAGVGGGVGLVVVVVLGAFFPPVPLFQAGYSGFLSGLVAGGLTAVLHGFLFGTGSP